jgi:hypothetical protein
MSKSHISVRWYARYDLGLISQCQIFEFNDYPTYFRCLRWATQQVKIGIRIQMCIYAQVHSLRIVFQKFLSAKQLSAVETGGIRWFTWGNHRKMKHFLATLRNSGVQKGEESPSPFGSPDFCFINTGIG